MAEYKEELSENSLYILSDFFKAIGNHTRIGILLLLMEQDACVSDLADRLGITQSAVSHQLSLLKSNKLVRQRRVGKKIFYTLADEHICTVVKTRTEHILSR